MHREVCTRKSFYTELGIFLFIASFYTKQVFAHSKLLPRFFNTQNFLHRYFFTQKFLNREAFIQRSFYTQQALTQRSSYTEKLLHTESFHTQKPLHSFYPQKPLHTANFYTQQAFTQRSFYTEKILNREAFAHGKLFEGSLEVKLPTIWTDEKQRWEDSAKRREEERESLRRKKIQMREKVGKSRNAVFPMICGSGGSKSRLAKAAGAEPAGQMRDEKLYAVVARSTFHKSKCAKHTSFGPLLGVALSKKCTQLWGEAHFEVKMHKTHQLRTTFGSCNVEKVHAVVARSTFRSQNAQNTPASDHFWKLRCRKRSCGAKYISKSTC